MVREMQSALDRSLTRDKVRIAAVTCLAGSCVVVAGHILPTYVELPAEALLLSQACLLLLILGYTLGIIGQLAFIEIANFRLAEWSEVKAGLGRNVFRFMVSYLCVAGVALLIIFGLREAPTWLLTTTSPLQETRAPLVVAVALLSVVVEPLTWPLLPLGLLLGPIIVIEECSTFAALRQWWALLRGHVVRLLLYEILAVGFAVLAALPFTLLLQVTAHRAAFPAIPPILLEGTLGLLQGLALAPAVSFLVVAHVAIYLNVKYDHSW
jgi:hypothetical protein